MNVSGNVGQTAEANVVPLFAKIKIETQTETSQLLPETLTEWDLNIDSEEQAPVMVARSLVTENHFPDQSLFILNDQVSKLKESIDRLKFYLNDVDDLLPRKS